MAQKRIEGRKNAAGVAAKKPPHIIIFRHFNRTYSLGTVILFADDSAALDGAAKERLDEIVPLLRGKPNKIEIRVYAPRKPVSPGGKFADAWQLARARSMTVRQYLVDNQIPAERLRLTQEALSNPTRFIWATINACPVRELRSSPLMSISTKVVTQSRKLAAQKMRIPGKLARKSVPC